jgi:hypothetical protein
MASLFRCSSGRRYFSIAFVMLCSLIISWASLHAHRSIKESTAQLAMAPIWPLSSAEAQLEIDRRMVFPYSIIPGGAKSQKELRQAVTMDPVVAQHYSDFDLARVRRTTLSVPQLMYVSYRIGNNVFWTKNKLMLPKGEAMLTDGHVMARTRCGNRVSAFPIKPNAVAEPTPEEFNAPIFAHYVSTPYLAAYSAPPRAFPSGAAIQSTGSSISPYTPIVSFFSLPGGSGGRSLSTPPPGGGGGGSTPPPPIVTAPGSPVGVPEPGTAGLVLVGLGAVWLARRRPAFWRYKSAACRRDRLLKHPDR